MVTVHVEPAGDGWKCVVVVDQGGDRTTHSVTVKRVDAERWAGGTEPGDVQDLVLRSFEFLLEREAAGRSSRDSTSRRSSAISPTTTE